MIIGISFWNLMLLDHNPLNELNKALTFLKIHNQITPSSTSRCCWDTNSIKFMKLKLICSSYCDKARDKISAGLSLEQQISTIKMNFSSFRFCHDSWEFSFLFRFFHILWRHSDINKMKDENAGKREINAFYNVAMTQLNFLEKNIFSSEILNEKLKNRSHFHRLQQCRTNFHWPRHLRFFMVFAVHLHFLDPLNLLIEHSLLVDFLSNNEMCFEFSYGALVLHCA